MTAQFKDQQCNVVGLAVGWVAYPAVLAYFAFQREWILAVFWMLGMPAMRWALYHFFPNISRFLGYGRIADAFPAVQPARAQARAPAIEVTFYSFFSCPFCPIVLARLHALQKDIGFHLTAIDVTLKPHTLIAKGIRSVPVVEVGDRRLVGNSTSEQLAGLITMA